MSAFVGSHVLRAGVCVGLRVVRHQTIVDRLRSRLIGVAEVTCRATETALQRVSAAFSKWSFGIATALAVGFCALLTVACSGAPGTSRGGPPVREDKGYLNATWGNRHFHSGHFENDFESVDMTSCFLQADLDGDGSDEVVVETVAIGRGGNEGFSRLNLVRRRKRGWEIVEQFDTADGTRDVDNISAFGPGRFLVNYRVLGPNDPHCCPTLRRSVVFTIVGNELIPVTVANAPPAAASTSVEPPTVRNLFKALFR